MADSSQTGNPQMEIPIFGQQPRGRNLELVRERNEEPTPSTSAQIQEMRISLARKEQELQQAIGILKVALGALGQRLLTVVSLLASCVMFGWAVWQPEPWRIASACLFALLVLAPLVILDARGRHGQV